MLSSNYNKYNYFIKILKKNEIFFIEEEYVIFYELDPTNIVNDKRELQHKSKKWSKYFNSFIDSLSTFLQSIPDVNYNTIINLRKNGIWFLFYYMSLFNKKYVIKRNFFKRFIYHNILTFNFLKKKLNITLRYKNKLISSITPGIITKKLDIETKKNKKSTKINNIMIKSMLKTYRNNPNPHKLIIQIKGTKLAFFKVVDFCKEIIKTYTDAYFIFTPSISNNKKHFKKVRSLKRNFRKKYFKN